MSFDSLLFFINLFFKGVAGVYALCLLSSTPKSHFLLWRPNPVSQFCGSRRWWVSYRCLGKYVCCVWRLHMTKQATVDFELLITCNLQQILTTQLYVHTSFSVFFQEHVKQQAVVIILNILNIKLLNVCKNINIHLKLLVIDLEVAVVNAETGDNGLQRK